MAVKYRNLHFSDEVCLDFRAPNLNSTVKIQIMCDSFKVGGPGQAEEVKIVELNEHYEDAELTPCQTYAYQVATIVGEQESARTELVNLRVPPR